jgi:hypothetical protein
MTKIHFIIICVIIFIIGISIATYFLTRVIENFWSYQYSPLDFLCWLMAMAFFLIVSCGGFLGAVCTILNIVAPVA